MLEKFEKKHGVAILLNNKWREKINWTERIGERAMTTSITVNKQRITLMSVYFHHSGYADHHVERAYNSIEKITKSTKNMQIVGGDFNAELGPGMTQWLMLQKFVALNTMYRKTPEKQVTYRTPTGAEKQLDYILVNRKYLRCSKAAEANDMIHMGSDHRSVMAQFVIPAPKKKTPKIDSKKKGKTQQRRASKVRRMMK